MATLEMENLIQTFIACLDHFIAHYFPEIRFLSAGATRETFYSWASLMFQEALS